jgi:peptidyl-prolyl cis-trans isomerase D
VEAGIKQQIAASRAVDQVQALHDKIEDSKSQGKTVSEAAKAAGLEARAYAQVDREGKTPDGKDADVLDKTLLLPAVFASDVGVDDEAIPTKDGGYMWFSVTKIDPAHDRLFDEVKDKVAESWRAQEIAKRLADNAADLVKKLDAGGDVAELAKADNAQVKTAKEIRRAGGGGLAPNVVAAVFEVGPTGASSVATPDGRLVFKVTSDTTPAPLAADPGVKMAEDRLKGELGQSLVEQYVDALKRQIGVSIDQRVLQSAEGG